MRRLLPTLTASRDALRRLMSMTFVMATIITFSVEEASGQFLFGQTECSCLNNGSDDTNGQFQEEIFVTSSAGENWTVVSSTGLFEPSSPAPPADPTPLAAGTVLTPNMSGTTYMLTAIREADTSWEVILSNGASQFTRSSEHVCSNPSEAIIGDATVCGGGIETYALEAEGANSIVWSVSGGTIQSGQGTREITVDWGMMPGSGNVSFTAMAPSFINQTFNFCDIEGSMPIDVMSEEPFALACNNTVNVSLNGQCDLSITADMILEDMRFSNMSYDLEFRDLLADTIIPGPTIGMEYINTTIVVKVIHDCGGNSCWGYVLLEDKAIPNLTCPDDLTLDCDEINTPEETGFPVPDDVIITKIDDDEYLAQGFDLCSDVTLLFSDEVISENLCQGPYSSIIERKWRAIDESGNETSCSYMINVNRATLADITFPDNWDDVLGPNPSIDACSNYPQLPNGHPDPSYTGEPEGVFCLNVNVSYEDLKLGKCSGDTYKLRRKWTITDLCHTAGALHTIEHTQSITVADNTPPSCSAPAPYTVSTGDHDCSSIIDVIPPVVTDCSDWTYTVSYKPVVPGEDPYFQPSNDGVVDNGDGTYTILELPAHEGSVYIIYYIEDECGNRSQCHTTVTVEDDVQPIPVCDLHTFVAVGDDGIAYASIDAFDDGSFDNCAVETIEVRRMENFACGSAVNWSDRVKFCCADIGNVVMVQLRVTDKSGNSNVCMVEAEVQDNHAPEITFCPANVTVDCDDDIDNLEQYGMATATDNCNVTVTSSVSRNINDCGEGTVRRTFTATDDYGNTDVCVQVITVRSLDPFYINPINPNDSFDDIVWPGNVSLSNGCADSSIRPENLPSGQQEPRILREACSQVSFSYDDVVFQYVEEACIKVLRKWTVIDHCAYLGPFSTQGVWSYTQSIKIENSTKPTFVSGCSAGDLAITQVANCMVQVEGAAQATDDCTPSDELKYSYRLDLDNNGSVDDSGFGRFVNETVAFGTHKITYEVEDQCGNVETCDVIFTVEDDKAPTPYCLSEIVTVIMSENGEAEIWASDFDNGSFDNCSDSDDLIASFSTNTSDRVRRFTCDDLTDTIQLFELQVYITDPSGNFDFCTTTLKLQDNQNVCGNLVGGGGGDEQGRVVLAGHIYNDEDEMLQEVSLTLNAALPEFPRQALTDGDGAYAFSDLLGAESYTVLPNADDNYRDGVNTLDLVKIQRHILGLETLQSPYKVIAADINNDEKVAASDLLQLRKLILGVYDELPRNSSWRFVDAAYDFPDAQDPFPFEEELVMEQMMSDYMAADFVAVKIGDVDGSATGFRPDADDVEFRATTSIEAKEELLAIGYNEVPVSVRNVDQLYGMQLVLAVNENLVADISVSSDVLHITDDHVRYAAGKLYISVSEAIPARMDRDLLTLKIVTRDEAYVSDVISLDVESLQPQLIVEENDGIVAESFGLNILGRSTDVEHDFELFQNVPNPFATTTDIAFVLPSRQQVTLTVMDITGKRVYTRQGVFQKGYNVMTLDINDINANGILHYQLDSETDSANKKMIIIK